MINLRQITYACRDYSVDPADYGFASHEEILALVRENPKEIPYTNVIEFQEKEDKKFSIEHLKQLVAARGFLEVFCDWVVPNQIEDKKLRGKTAIIQLLLSEIWEKLNG